MKVLFFARLREALDCSELNISVEGTPNNIRELREQLAARSTRWANELANNNLLVAVNQEIVSDDHPLNAEDEVAFFPPVTGG